MFRTRFVTALSILAVGTLAVAAVRPALLQDEMPMPVPADQHKMLQKSVGEYEGTITMSMPGMPTEPNAAMETVAAFGPFWIETHFRCSFMGMPYEGKGQVGYDPGKGKYVGTWTDNMSAFLSIMEGDYDEENETLTMTWMAPDMMGQMTPHKYEMKHTEDGYFTQFWQGPSEDKMEKSMQIKMKRKPVEASSGR